MNTEIYREFMTLAAHKSFVSAARDLNLSQPALSRHIAAFEKELGCKVFYDTRPLSLTTAGEMVLKYAGKIIGDEANMLTALRALPSSSNKRILILDMLHTNALYIGIKEVATLAKKEFVGLDIEFLNLDNSGLNAQQMIEKGKIDLSFETIITDDPQIEPKFPESIRAIWIPEFYGELVVGVAKESPLASRTDLQLSELSQSRFILQANRHSECFQKCFIDMCLEVGFYPNITLVPSNNPLEFYAANPLDGIHLLSRVDKKYKPLIADLLKQNVAILPLTDKKRYVSTYIFMKKDSSRPELQFFADHLEQHAERFRKEL